MKKFIITIVLIMLSTSTFASEYTKECKDAIMKAALSMSRVELGTLLEAAEIPDNASESEQEKLFMKMLQESPYLASNMENVVQQCNADDDKALNEIFGEIGTMSMGFKLFLNK